MPREVRTRRKFDEAFKRDIVRRIQAGELTPRQAADELGMKQAVAIYRWMKKYGNGDVGQVQTPERLLETLTNAKSMDSIAGRPILLEKLDELIPEVENLVKEQRRKELEDQEAAEIAAVKEKYGALKSRL